MSKCAPLLVIPSWYATPQAPTSGSFFKEQSRLVEQAFDIRMLTVEKDWISARRYWFYQWMERMGRYHRRPAYTLVTEAPVAPPTIIHVKAEFVGDTFDQTQNMVFWLENIAAGLDQYISDTGWKPALIHAHGVIFGGLIAAYLGTKYDIPYIITEHRTDSQLHVYPPFLWPFIQKAMENATLMLSVSDYQRQQMLLYGFRSVPVTIGNLVDDGLFVPVPKSYEKSVFRLLTIAYYPIFTKDVETLLEAVALLVQQGHQDIRLEIIGGGEMQGGELPPDHYQTCARQLGISDFCLFTSGVPRTQMPDKMRSADLYVCPSIAETFGLAPCEALLCHVPVVSTDNGGIRAFATDQDMVIVPIKDPQAMAAGILRVKEGRVSFDFAAIRQRIVAQYGREAFRQRILDLYAQALSQYPKKP